jgi:hypothetical protein
VFAKSAVAVRAEMRQRAFRGVRASRQGLKTNEPAPVQRGAGLKHVPLVPNGTFRSDALQGPVRGELPEGRCARSEFFRSAMTCPMIAWRRWSASACTIIRGELVNMAVRHEAL